MAKKTTKPGKLNMGDMKKLLNKKAGTNVAYNLGMDENPTEVKEWIPTGSRWLDSIICRGQLGGIPMGKITEIAGLEGTGKSFMAAQIAGNAQKMGINVFYFDSESAVDPTFWVKAGCEVDDMLYIQASSVEQVMEFIEEILGVSERSLFIWDSLAMTPCNSDIEGDFNPNSSMAVKARLLSKAFQKLTVPLANANSAFLVLNQLKTNIPQGPNARIEIMTTPYVTPGGKALNYSASLRIWLTGRKAKASFVYDDTKEVIGSEVKATLQKSRFGTLKRTSIFKILWGNKVGIQDEESWLEAIKGSDRLQNAGSWYTIKTDEGKEFKFQPSKWDSMIKENDEFRAYILKIMDEELINKFDKRGEKT